MKNIFIILFLFSVSKSIAQNTAGNLVYQNNDEKIELKIVNGNDSLSKGKNNAISINVENIDIKTTLFTGMGVHFLGTSNENKIILDIDLTNQKVKKTFTLNFSYKKAGNFYHGKFEIPVKNP